MTHRGIQLSNKRRWLFSRNTANALLVFIGFGFCGAINAQANSLASETDCSSVIESLQYKNSNLSAALLSIDSLLHSKSVVEVPLATLFQVDLGDEKDIATRVAELSQLTTNVNVLKQPEFKNFNSCAKRLQKEDLLHDVVKKQIELNSRKLDFLRLDKSTRDLLIAAFGSATRLHSDKKHIEQQLSDSRESLERAQINLIKSDRSISKSRGASSEALISARSLLEKFLIDIEVEHIEFINEVKNERLGLEGLREQLSAHTKIDLSREEISTEFLLVDAVWRSAAEYLLHTFGKISIASRFSLPERVENPAAAGDEQKLFQEYYVLHEEAKQHLAELAEQKHNLLLDLKALNFRLVNDSGRLRANLINQCKSLGSCEGVGGLNENTLTGTLMEMRILPLKFLAGGFNQLVEFNTKIGGGFDGWTDVIKQIFIFIFVALLPFLAHMFLNWLSEQLNELRKKILLRSIMDYRRRTQMGLWISRLNPFVPSMGMVGSLHLARILIEETDLQELSYLLFYLEIYFIYKVTRILLKILMELLFSSGTLSVVSSTSEKAERSARRLARFFFGQYVFLHIVEDAVRRALVYGFAHEILFWLSLLVLINEASNWQSEIVESFNARFGKISLKARSVIEGRFKILVLPIILVFVVGHDLVRVVSIYLIRFDFFKRLLSEVFKKQLEHDSDVSKHLKTPDADYVAYFDYYLPAKKEFYVDRDPMVAKKILKTIEGWLQGVSTEDLVVLVGNRGLGKTTSAKMIFDSIDTDSKAFWWAEPKICSAVELFNWLSSLMERPIHSVDDFVKMESALENKLVLVVDDVHNLFIGKIGGFEAYRVFMEIISLRTTNIFWCLTANSRAWTYLKGVFGKEHFYGQVYEMRMWTDAEIQNLILARHNITGFIRSFDRSISAYGTGNVLGEQAETQFFRLLWGQSRGNPRSALMYWISAVSQVGNKHLHVGVPKFISSGVVGTMSNEALIILATIARHDSLTQEELFQVTRIDKLIIRKVIKESLDKELVWIDNSFRIRISSRAQNAIDYYLVGKNFLYE